jgi:ribosomal protein L37AE/L43A
MTDNNDYTNLDWLFPNTPSVLNEDTSAGKEKPPAVAPSVSVNNPPDNKIPADQKKTDKPAEDAPKFKCPKCMAESAETETKGKYKCSKCGQTFTVDECVKEDAEFDKQVLTPENKKMLGDLFDKVGSIGIIVLTLAVLEEKSNDEKFKDQQEKIKKNIAMLKRAQHEIELG